MKKERRQDALELLSCYRGAIMGLAALGIVMLHCWLLIIPNRPVLGKIEAFVKWNGILGLDVFFFYSGLSQTYAIRRNTLSQYYLRRLERVVIPYWIMALLCAYTGGWSLGTLARHALGITFFTETIFAHLWYVPAILVVYLFFPLYHRLMMRSGSKLAFSLCTVCAWLYASVLLRDVVRADVWYFTNRLPAFMLGVFVGELAREKPIRMTGTHWALCVLWLAVGWMIKMEAIRGKISLIPDFSYVGEALAAAALCFLLSGVFDVLQCRGGAVKAVAGLLLRFLAFIGMFTLELYCIHQWLFAIVYTALEGHVSYLTINAVIIPVSIAAGWLFYRVHMWILRLAHRAARREA